jgi:hypothetical protein
MNGKSAVLDRELILVPCHGIWMNSTVHRGESTWCCDHPEEGPCYACHAKAAAFRAAENPSSTLVFSGGMTLAAAGPRSEAQSYLEFCGAMNWWNTEPPACVLLEEYARDSLENLLFAIAVFARAHHSWPDRIAVFGWEFKQQRFERHRAALGWPSERFEYIGVNNPADRDLPAAKSGEARKLAALDHDIFLNGPEWRDQRTRRNPFQRVAPYEGVHHRLDRVLQAVRTGEIIEQFPWHQA